MIRHLLQPRPRRLDVLPGSPADNLRIRPDLQPGYASIRVFWTMRLPTG